MSSAYDEGEAGTTERRLSDMWDSKKTCQLDMAGLYRVYVTHIYWLGGSRGVTKCQLFSQEDEFGGNLVQAAAHNRS